MDIAPLSLANAAAFICFSSLKGTLLVLAALFIQKTAGRFLSAGARHLLWFPVVIALVMPIGFELTLPAGLLAQAPVRQFMASVRATETGGVERAPTLDTATPQIARNENAPNISTLVPTVTTSFQLPVLTLLPYLWLTGVVAVLGAVAMSCLRFSRIVRRASPAANAVQLFLRECMAQTACKSTVSVRISAETQVPMIAGLLHPVLLLPAGLEHQLARAQLRHVFIHELMHLQRGDIVSNWIVALVQALHWFNPIVWFAFYCMRQDRELACDAATLQHLAPHDRAAYGQTLLRLNDTVQHSSTSPLALGMLDASSHLEKRILMLVHSSRARKFQTRAATLLFLPLAAVAFSQPAVREAEPAVAAEPAAQVAEPVAAAIAEPAMVEPRVGVAAPALAEPVLAVVETAPPAMPIAEAVMPAAEPVAPALEEPVRSLGSVSPDTMLLARLSESALSVPITVAAAASATQLAAAAPDPDLATAILQLADEVSTARTDGIRFIEELDAAAAACTARGDGILATLSTPCAKTRRAMRRGHVFFFGYQCYLLGARQEDLVGRYRQATNGEPGASSLDSALRANAANLASFCSKDIYAQQYPAFASLVAEAESLDQFKPGGRTLETAIALTNKNLRDTAWSNASWYDIGNGRGGGMEGSGAYGGAVPAAAAPAAAAGGDSGGAAAPAQ